ncbi:MAG: hypothetical protein AAGI07_14970 [Bacteroidota bacterium]
MQNFELLLLVVLIAVFITNYVSRRFDEIYFVILIVLALLTNLVFDGYRWQMVPTYLLSFSTLFFILYKTSRKSSLIAIILKTFGWVVLITLSFILPLALPVFELPEPTGPYNVGTRDIYLQIDGDEKITIDKTDKRELMIKVWYPSTSIGSNRDIYIDKAGRNGFAKKYGIPTSILNYLNSVKPKVFREIKIADESFPILIFSHGYHSKANGYYALLTEIASRGYVILGINHTYESTGTTFLDGSEKYFDNEFAKKIEEGSWETISPVIEALNSELSFEDRHSIIKKALKTYYAKEMVERWAQDIIEVVAHLDRWNNSDFFNGSLDISKVGVFGHSRGGAASGESLLIDDRIKAAANIDGDHWGQIVDTIFQKPFLYLSSEWTINNGNLNQYAYINRSTSYFYNGILLKSGHSNFMDIPYMIPIQSLNQAGSIDHDTAIEITTNLLCAFFDKHLKNEEVKMSDLPLKYKLLELNIFKGNEAK